ncbi:GNVR domain-containing protein [Pseudomonas sp. SWI44]|uniref:GNVR domain-containing protein n=1 Tax=Pseudomonas sp. SWI44 TaxID=2083053 RepID=UPI0021159CCC|nr:GNVR domain-containing protein [Pseudomonas sp. SWI44]
MLVVAVASLCTVIGVAYATLSTPIYEASTILRPVALNQLDALNRSQIYTLTPTEALKKVGAALESYNTRLDFFRSRPDLIDAFQDEGQTLEQAFEDFNRNSLSMKQSDSKKIESMTDSLELNMIYEKGVEGAAFLNDFVDFAIERERISLSQDMQAILLNRIAEVDSKLSFAVAEYQKVKESRIAHLEEVDAIKRAELNDELKGLRVQLKLRREARLEQLEEAINIAKSLGLKKPSTPSLMADEASLNSNVIRTEVNSQQAPLYFLGVNVLEAERKALRERTSDDFMEPRIAQIRKELVMLSTNRKVQILKARKNEGAFLDGIEALRIEHLRLKRINTNLDGVDIVSIDRRAVASSKPVKPRKMVIVIISSVIGLLLGFSLAILRGAFKERERQARALDVDGGAKLVPISEGGKDLQLR